MFKKKFFFSLVAVVYLLALSFICLSQTYPKGLIKGDKAPLFEAKDLSGKTIKLKELLKKGDVVLVFYRGQWCPYCNKFLSQLEDSLSMIKDKGATVLAISPEIADGIKETINKSKASYPVLSDDGLKIMNMYKVNFSLSDKMLETYKSYNMDFNKLNGANGNNLPVPATYIIGKNGMIKYAYFNPDYSKRPPIKEILDQI